MPDPDEWVNRLILPLPAQIAGNVTSDAFVLGPDEYAREHRDSGAGRRHPLTIAELVRSMSLVDGRLSTHRLEPFKETIARHTMTTFQGETCSSSSGN
jgi:hypothetical protein